MAVPIQKQFERGVALGLFEGVYYVNKFGQNSDIGSATTPEDIWNGGSVYTGFPSSASQQVEVFSSDAADTAAGTGMQRIRVLGLEDFTSDTYIADEVELNGTTPVNLNQNFVRLSRARGLRGGSGETNAGTITIRHSATPANVFAQLPIGYGQTTIACWTVPANNLCFLTNIRAQMVRTGGLVGSAEVSLDIRQLDKSIWTTVEVFEISNSASVDIKLTFPFRVEGFADIRLRCTQASDNNTRIAGGFSCIYGITEDVVRAFNDRSGLDQDTRPQNVFQGL